MLRVLLLPGLHLEPPAGLQGADKETSALRRQRRNGNAADLGAAEVVGRARGLELVVPSVAFQANTCLKSHQPETQDRLLSPQLEAGMALARQLPLQWGGCCAHASGRSSQVCSQPCSSQMPSRKVAATEHGADVGHGAAAEGSQDSGSAG